MEIKARNCRELLASAFYLCEYINLKLDFVLADSNCIFWILEWVWFIVHFHILQSALWLFNKRGTEYEVIYCLFADTKVGLSHSLLSSIQK